MKVSQHTFDAFETYGIASFSAAKRPPYANLYKTTRLVRIGGFAPFFPTTLRLKILKSVGTGDRFRPITSTGVRFLGHHWRAFQWRHADSKSSRDRFGHNRRVYAHAGTTRRRQRALAMARKAAAPTPPRPPPAPKRRFENVKWNFRRGYVTARAGTSARAGASGRAARRHPGASAVWPFAGRAGPASATWRPARGAQTRAHHANDNPKINSARSAPAARYAPLLVVVVGLEDLVVALLREAQLGELLVHRVGHGVRALCAAAWVRMRRVAVGSRRAAWGGQHRR